MGSISSRRSCDQYRRGAQAPLDDGRGGPRADALHPSGSRLVAEPRGILIGLEPHQQYSKHPEGLDRIFSLVKSPSIGINFDTGNAYLCGHDPYTWLERVADRLVHLHAKDISTQQATADRGKITGTPVGCACGDGVIDWPRIVAICRMATRDIAFSVECGTVDQAARSVKHLRALI